MAYRYDMTDESRGYRMFSWCLDTCGEGAELLEEGADRLALTPIVSIVFFALLVIVLFPLGLCVRAVEGYRWLRRRWRTAA